MYTGGALQLSIISRWMESARHPLLIVDAISKEAMSRALRDAPMGGTGDRYVFNSLAHRCLSVLIGHVSA
jgi:hypothetical protein